MKLIGADYLLLLLFLNDREPIKGTVKLMKMMFLFDKQIAPALKKGGLCSEDLPEFIPYNYGPFSKDIYQQIDLFANIGFIGVNDINSDEELSYVDSVIENEFIDECYEEENGFSSVNSFWVYSITEKGIGYVKEKILPHIKERELELLKEFKRKITSISNRQLLYYVYINYPEYTEKSLIKDEVLNNGK